MLLRASASAGVFEPHFGPHLNNHGPAAFLARRRAGATASGRAGRDRAGRWRRVAEREPLGREAASACCHKRKKAARVPRRRLVTPRHPPADLPACQQPRCMAACRSSWGSFIAASRPALCRAGSAAVNTKQALCRVLCMLALATCRPAASRPHRSSRTRAIRARSTSLLARLPRLPGTPPTRPCSRARPARP